MTGKARDFVPLSKEDADKLGSILDDLRKESEAKFPKELQAFDETALKPLQKLMAGKPEPDEVRRIDFGLGEILKQEFDLDWVSAETETGHEIALHIPLSVHLIYPTTFFSEPHRKSGKVPNVRTTYLHWVGWINDHQFDAEGEIDL